MQLNQVKQIIKNPVNREVVARARKHQARIRFHTRTALSDVDAGSYVTDFLEDVKPLLTTEGYHTFLNLFRFPINSVEITERIRTAFSKVFDGRNPLYSYVFTNPDHYVDWMEYKRENVNWRIVGLDAMMENVNDIAVIDLPREQMGDRPDPYMYIVDIRNVVDYDEGRNGIKWLYYKSGDKSYFIDGEFYRVFEEGKDGEMENLEEIPHELGYCPCRFIWDDRTEMGVRKSPLTNELTNLDRYVFYDILNQHLNTYARFPVYWGYERQCDYSDERSVCDKGFLKNGLGKHIVSFDGKLQKCPVCSEKQLGAGAFVEVPEPEDGVDMRDPIGIVKIDKQSLDFNDKAVKELGKTIYSRVTGKDSSLISDHAINVDQISAIHESELTALNRIKHNLEKLIQWAESTMCAFRYETFVEANINLGTEFYMFTYSELSKIYSYMLKDHHDSVMLDSVQEEMHVVKYKNNPDMLERARLINNLTPYRHITKVDATEMYRNGVMSELDFYLICNMSSYLMRFERENGDITKFGNKLRFDQKINNIKETLYEYAKETRSRKEIRTEETSAETV